jgi:hypothetical protein
MSEVKRLVVAVPDKAEFETGFTLWFDRIKNISSQLSIGVLFFASKRTTDAIKELCDKQKLKNVDFKNLESWEYFIIISKLIKPHDSLIIISARKSTLSFHPLLDKVPYYITKYFNEHNFIIIFPKQTQQSVNDGDAYNPLKVN